VECQNVRGLTVSPPTCSSMFRGLRIKVIEMIECLVVGLGGFLGAVMRYLVGLVPVGAQGGFPYKTLAINVVGAFAIGVVVAFAARGVVSPRWELFLKVGICGGFTTFSTFALECDQLAARGSAGQAVLYVCLSLSLGMLAAFIGQRVAG